jgi:polysaccharide deacetylase family protein (PEP-CTERM system associated)
MPIGAPIAFSVDLEDWYHGVELPFDNWGNYQKRVEIGLNRILELTAKYNIKGTFFTLGWIAEKYPEIIRQVAAQGHELASHGYSHEKVYNLTPVQFRQEVATTKKLIEDITGQKLTAYRAPYFSITSQSLWALNILAEEGYKIDCSISPVKTWRYGIASCPPEIFRIEELGLIEYPVSTFTLLTKKWAIGGAYFRILPYWLTKSKLKGMNSGTQNNMFYIHPWEYDPQHPLLPGMEKKARFTHYRNLKSTYGNTEQLFKDFNFGTVSSIIKNNEERNSIRSHPIQILAD